MRQQLFRATPCRALRFADIYDADFSPLPLRHAITLLLLLRLHAAPLFAERRHFSPCCRVISPRHDARATRYAMPLSHAAAALDAAADSPLMRC